MSGVLLIGHNPPHFVGSSKIEAAHYRTWQFLEPLLADDHAVCLCVDGSHTNHTEPPSSEDWAGQLQYHALPFRHKVGWVSKLQRIHDTFEPNCIVAVDFNGCLCVTRLRTNKPIWMDGIRSRYSHVHSIRTESFAERRCFLGVQHTTETRAGG
jgi:hypothetical protein